MNHDRRSFDRRGKLIRDFPLSGLWRGISADRLENEAPGLRLNSRQLAAAEFVLVNAMVAGPGVWVSYSRNGNWYNATKRRYHGGNFTFASIPPTVDELVRVGLLESQLAKPGDLHWQSAFRASGRILEVGQGWGPFFRAPGETIRMRDDDGHLIDYRETRSTIKLRRQMAIVNEALAAIKISTTNPALDFSRLRVAIEGQIFNPGNRFLYRVFNAQWNRGGRLFGAFYQNLPKEERCKFLLDGHPVREPDHAQLHPRLLYARYGTDLNGNAYTIPGVERSDAKLAWQIMINADSKNAAIKAVMLDFNFTWAEAMAMLDALEARHRPIARAFYSGIGLRLQHQDAELLLRVLERGFARGIAGLPVHDSLIVKAGREADAVEGIMQDELESEIRRVR